MDDSYLSHHGILGMKWGIRRYQNPDGSLTDAGRKRYEKKLKRKVFISEQDDLNADIHTNGKNFIVDPRNHKNYERVYKEIERTENRIKPNITYTKDIDSEFGQNISMKYRDKILSARLKDLGEEDTAYGREVLAKILDKENYAYELGYPYGTRYN